jgi:hypothetical protein
MINAVIYCSSAVALLIGIYLGDKLFSSLEKEEKKKNKK